MPKYLNNIADMQQEAEEKRAAMRREREEADRVGDEQQQAASDNTAAALVPDASASGNSTKSKGKLTKLTDQGVTQLVITDAFKKHTITMYEPLYQLMNAMAKAWNTNLQDVAALVMMVGVRDLKGKDRAKINRLVKSFVSEDTDKEIEEMRTAYLREHTAALLAQAGLTPDDLKTLTGQQ